MADKNGIIRDRALQLKANSASLDGQKRQLSLNAW